MNVGNYTKLGPKGQIVIPVEIRDKLRIDQSTILNVRKVGDGVYIQPSEVRPVFPSDDAAFLEMLRRNRGFMAGDPNFSDSMLTRRKKLEAAAQKKTRKLW